jgi:uncharacterized protein DUF1236
MERRLLLSTVAVALALGTAAASAQTRRPVEQNQNAPQATPSQNEPRANPQSGAGAQNAPQNAPKPQGQAQQTMPAQPNTQNAQQPPPSATTGQAAPPAQPNPSNAANQPQQPAAGQAQTQPQQGMPAQGQGQGQAQDQGPAQPGVTQGAAGANGAASDANAQQNGNTNANAGAQDNPQGVITLNEQQNTRFAQAIRQANVRPLTNVNFSIAVGTTIPADVQLNVLPLELVDVVPQYRGFSFVVVEQEALIIDPGTRAIVAVVPFEAQQTTGANQAAPPPASAPPQAAAPPPRERKKTDLTRDQREIPRRQAERHHKADKNKHVIEERRSTTGAGPRDPRAGDRVPDRPVIEGRPVEVYRDEPRERDERHHPSVRDIPLIGPLFGPRDED